MGEKLVSISVNVPNVYLEEIKRIIAKGKINSKSEFVRRALNHYLKIEEKFLIGLKNRQGVNDEDLRI